MSGLSGRTAFYDRRRYHWTKQPFSEAGLVALAAHLGAGVRALTLGPKKVLVVDLDDTLWGGVVGERGAEGITLGDGPAGEAFVAFQRHLKGLAARGVALAVCSKNNLADAQEPFLRHAQMPLSLDDIACFVANWEPKPQNLRHIAQQLNLGLDSFVFFDDNPAEREAVRQALPEVGVVEVPADPAEYVDALQRGLWFEAVALTEEDRLRGASLRAEQQRSALQDRAASLDDYLRSLQMRARLGDVAEADLPRLVQLLARTNQFNLSTRRHGEAALRALLDAPRALGLSLRLADRFADHGLVALLLAQPEAGDDGALRIDSFVMSCRVIGRGVEDFFVDALLQRARALGFERVIGEYIPSPRNGLVATLYPRLGFQPLPAAGPVQRWALRLDPPPRLHSFVAVQ